MMVWDRISLFVALGIVLALVLSLASWSRRSAACPDGYVSVYRTTGQPACAAYVVEPVK